MENDSKALEHFDKLLDLWEDADSRITELEDARTGWLC